MSLREGSRSLWCRSGSEKEGGRGGREKVVWKKREKDGWQGGRRRGEGRRRQGT